MVSVKGKLEFMILMQGHKALNVLVDTITGKFTNKKNCCYNSF
jgi:hypothetical protein